MFYDYAIVVPANTLESAPVTQFLKLTRGIIHRVEVQFPIGTLALAHCRIFYHEHQAFPTNPDGDFSSDGYVIPIDDQYEIDSEPYDMKAVCWNLDDTYQHIITVRVGILRYEEIEKRSASAGAMQRFLKLMRVGV